MPPSAIHPGNNNSPGLLSARPAEKTLRSTVALTAARGRGKSAALGLAIAGEEQCRTRQTCMPACKGRWRRGHQKGTSRP